jgi:N-acyl-D-aspartate/D-glutamate deacylase
VEVGPELRPDGEPQIDAAEAFVAPGFIDTHTHFDPSVFWSPSADPMPQHGVTTVLTGNCSLSLAPLRAEHRQEMSSVFAYIEDLPKQAFESAIPWSWETFAEYRAAMSELRFGVNVAPLVGHTPLRLYVMGSDAWERAATEDEVRQLASVLDDSLRAGAFGLSTSFHDRDIDSRLVPSQFADDAELGALLDVLGARDRVVEFIPDFIDQPNGTFRGIIRMGDLCGPRQVKMTWNVLTFQAMDGGQFGRDLLDLTNTQMAAGIRVYPQVSPRPFDLKINWNTSASFKALPNGWHQVIIAPVADKQRLLEDPAWRDLARNEWDSVPRSFAFPHREPELARFVSVTRDENRRWLGKTLADLVAERGGHPSDVLADWVLENDCNPGVVAMGLANGDPAGVAELVNHPATIVSASDAGAHQKTMCTAGDSTLLLTRHVRERGDLPIEKAVHELSGRQADVFGMEGRGRVVPGAHADLTVFALNDLVWTYDAEFMDDVPEGGGRLRRPAGGYRYTVISGAIVQEEGVLTGTNPGTLLTA